MIAYRAHISAHKRQKLVRCFVNDIVATQAAKEVDVDRNTANHWYRFFRQCIFEHESQLRRLSGEVEVDHSFFGATGNRRFKKIDGKKVLLSRQKFLVFGFLERHPEGGHVVRTYHIKRADTDTLMPLVRLVIEPGARVYSDSWRSFNPLADDGYVHRTVNHRKKQFAKKDGAFSVHTGTLDQYFKFAKSRLSKFCRLHPSTLHLHLAECSFRYNNKDLAPALKKLLK